MEITTTGAVELSEASPAMEGQWRATDLATKEVEVTIHRCKIIGLEKFVSQL